LKLTIASRDASTLPVLVRREYEGDDLSALLSEGIGELTPRERIAWIHIERDVDRVDRVDRVEPTEPTDPTDQPEVTHIPLQADRRARAKPSVPRQATGSDDRPAPTLPRRFRHHD
jgi:hypothetical protein